MADQPLDLTCPPRYWPDTGNKLPVTGEFSKLSVNIPVSVGNKGDIRSTVNGNNGQARRFSNCSSDNISLTSDRPLSLSPSSAGYSRNDSGAESPVIDNRRRLGGSDSRGGGKTIGDSDCMSSAGSHSDYESGEGSPSPKAMHRSSPTVVDSAAASPPLATSGPATKRFLTKYIEEHKGKTFYSVIFKFY